MFAYFTEMRGLKKIVIESHRHEGNKFLILFNRRYAHGKTMFLPQKLVQKHCLERMLEEDTKTKQNSGHRCHWSSSIPVNPFSSSRCFYCAW